MDLKKIGIQQAIKKNKIYKGLRWNLVEKGEDPNISTIGPTKFTKNQLSVCTILQLNSAKTEIIDSFCSKNFIAKKLGIGRSKMEKIIEAGTKINDCYFIEYNKCSQDPFG